MALALINDRTGDVVAGAVELALTRHARRRGLLGRDALDADAAVLLAPCMAVHTAFMGFPIDVVFIDRAGRAVHLVHGLRPWRITASLRARTVIELAAGRLTACGVEVGDRLYLEPAKGSALDISPIATVKVRAPGWLTSLSLARSARLGPLYGSSQRVQSSRLEPYSGPTRRAGPVDPPGTPGC